MRTKATGILFAVAVLLAASDSAIAQRFSRFAVRSYPAAPASPQELQLAAIIRQQQHVHVRESWGEEDWQCFTWADLQSFRAANVPGMVAKTLTNDPQFERLVSQIRAMDASSRSTLLTRVMKTYKPTWAQLGQVSRAGQTDAGQQAEIQICRTIVGLVRQMLEQP